MPLSTICVFYWDRVAKGCLRRRLIREKCILGTPNLAPYGRVVAGSAVTAQVITVTVPTPFIQFFIYILLRTNHSDIYTPRGAHWPSG